MLCPLCQSDQAGEQFMKHPRFALQLGNFFFYRQFMNIKDFANHFKFWLYVEIEIVSHPQGIV